MKQIALWLALLTLAIGAWEYMKSEASRRSPVDGNSHAAMESTGGDDQAEVTLTPDNNELRDVELKIQSVTRLPSQAYLIRARSKYKNEAVGLEVVVPSDLKELPLLEKGKPGVVYSQQVEFRSTGKESDALLRMLRELYVVDLPSSQMRQRVDFDGISLEGNSSDLPTRVVKIKLFGNTNATDENDYYELYLNVDLPHRILEIAEKDFDYRYPMIRGLSAPANRKQ